MSNAFRVFIEPITDLDGKEKTVAVSVTNERQTIEELTADLVRKLCLKAKPESKYELRLSGSDVLLDQTSMAREILQNEDLLVLCPVGFHRHSQRDESELKKSIYHIHHQQHQLRLHPPTKYLELDGYSLTIEEVVDIGLGRYYVKLSDKAIEQVKQSRKVIDSIVESEKAVYGVNTGFGRFASIHIPKEKTSELQENLIRSHAACTGTSLSLLRTRTLLTLRINVLARGCSGIRLETLQQLIDGLNVSCLPSIPEKGTVGASGDLGPLAHLTLGFMGEGEMWGPKTGWGNAQEVLHLHGLRPITLQEKEGLALINGTQFICALGSEALYRAETITKQADIVAALSIDVLEGTPGAFDRDIHIHRPHYGQRLVAARLRSILDSNIYPSEIREGHKNCSRVQDPYTMRCTPQVHGIVHDTLRFVRGILTTEINSATDNPIVLTNRKETICGGNFHGEYPAKALDYLAIGIHEIANMSERRIERMVHPAYSGLPAFLVENGGLNSGFMLAQVTAAALVSENKVLTHPSSVDSITTSAGTEDHVSMGGYAARKVLNVVENVEGVVAIELLAACQGLEFHRPKKTTAPLEEVYKLVRSVVKRWDKDRFMAPDIAAVTNLLQEGKIWEVVSPYITAYEDAVPTSPLNI